MNTQKLAHRVVDYYYDHPNLVEPAHPFSMKSKIQALKPGFVPGPGKARIVSEHAYKIEEFLSGNNSSINSPEILRKLHNLYIKTLAYKDKHTIRDYLLVSALVATSKDLMKNPEDIDTCIDLISLHGAYSITFTICKHWCLFLEAIDEARVLLSEVHIKIKEGSPEDIARIYMNQDGVDYMKTFDVNLCSGCRECSS